MGSSLRNRLSRVTEAPPGDPARGRVARARERGGVPRRPRPEGLVEQRPGRGQEASGPLSGLLGAAHLFGGTGSAVPSRAGVRSTVGDGGYERPAGLQLAARDAAGRAGSAFTGAAGLAARAGQSAASATRDASSTLAHRMSDASTRLAERSDRTAQRPAAGLDWQASRPSNRPRRERGRAWDESRGRPSWADRGPRAELAAGGRMGRIARRAGRRQDATMASRETTGRDGAGRVDEWAARMPVRGQARDAYARWERPADLGGQRWERAGTSGRTASRGADRAARMRTRDRQVSLREQDGETARWALPAGMTWEELSGGQTRVRGVSKRNQRRIEKAQFTADDLIERAYEASARATQHSHSRRARRSERKATTQADRAQRTLEQHLARAERRMARSHQRRRRGVGVLLLAGAGAGAAVAVRRYLAQPGADQPGLPRDERAGQRPMSPANGGFPGTDRLSERMASEATSGRMEEMPGVDTMIDPSSTRRF